jgi:hypothetical protein
MLFSMQLDTEDFQNDYQLIAALMIDLGMNLQHADGDITEPSADGALFQAILRKRETQEPVVYINVSDEPVDKTKWDIRNPTHTARAGMCGDDLHAIEEENPNVKH